MKRSTHIPEAMNEQYIKPILKFLFGSLRVVSPSIFARANPIEKNIIPRETGLKRLAGATAALIINCSYAPNSLKTCFIFSFHRLEEILLSAAGAVKTSVL
jgi:hypothetical protein